MESMDCKRFHGRFAFKTRMQNLKLRREQRV